jgi:hypothetical protein
MIYGKENEDFSNKSKLIYYRLLDLLLKLDHIDLNSVGEEYLNMSELNLDTRLQQKFNSMKSIWSVIERSVGGNL